MKYIIILMILYSSITYAQEKKGTEREFRRQQKNYHKNINHFMKHKGAGNVELIISCSSQDSTHMLNLHNTLCQILEKKDFRVGNSKYQSDYDKVIFFQIDILSSHDNAESIIMTCDYLCKILKKYGHLGSLGLGGEHLSNPNGSTIFCN